MSIAEISLTLRTVANASRLLDMLTEEAQSSKDNIGLGMLALCRAALDRGDVVTARQSLEAFNAYRGFGPEENL